MYVREMAPDEFEAALAMLVTMSVEESAALGGFPPPLPKPTIAKRMVEADEVFVAVTAAPAEKERLVGVAMTSSDLAHDGLRGRIDWLYVMPEHRRMGVGALLVATALATMREHKVKSAFCHVAGNNAASLALFEKAGFGTSFRVMTREVRNV